MIEYSSKDFTADIAVEDLIARFHDAERFLALCKKCSNYGNSWGCPPLAIDPVSFLSRYRFARVMATKVVPAGRDIPVDKALEQLRPETARTHKLLLAKEHKYSGRAFAFGGECLYCGDNPCRRRSGLPCLHPDKVRPSLEAFGFDIGRTLKELFGLRLVWAERGFLPEYLVIVTALFHNSTRRTD